MFTNLFDANNKFDSTNKQKIKLTSMGTVWVPLKSIIWRKILECFHQKP